MNKGHSFRSLYTMLAKGSLAPPFELLNQHGETITRAQFHGLSRLVIYFYPMDHTPGCIKEACDFRDSYAQIEASNTVVIGISRDSVKKHSSFSEKYGLPFHILSDTKGIVSKAYDAKGLLGLSSRVTYVIDIDGTIQAAYKNMLNPNKHIQEVLKTLKLD